MKKSFIILLNHEIKNMYEFKSTCMFQIKVTINDCQHIHQKPYNVSCLHLGEIFGSEDDALAMSL